MNVANIVFSFETGGIENLLVDVINNWPRNEKIILCIINDLKNDELISKIRKKDNIYLINRKPGSGFLNTIKAFIKLSYVIRKNKINIIHCHSNSVFKFSLPLKLLNPRLKFFLTIHNTNSYSKLKKSDLILQQVFLKYIFAISFSVVNEIEKRGFNEKKIKLLYNGVDYKKFNISKEKHKDKKTIVCIARLIPKIKGQDILIRAISRLVKYRSDFECLIVGSAPKECPENEKELLDLINKLNVKEYVKLLGNREDVPNILVNSDVFVLPSRFEGFGISIVEAMYAKTLVIVSDIEGPKEIVKDNEYGYLFKCDDDKELSEILNKALNDDNFEIINKAYKYAIDNYSIENMVKNLTNYYKL